MQTLRIATRQSPLAMWQAQHVQQQLQTLHPGLTVSLLPMTTRGDHILDSPLAKIGGKGLFVKELELALLEGRADLAVHSMKDVPMALPEGLHLSVIAERADPRDAFVSTHVATLDDLPKGARVGTSSLRRQCQLLAARPDLQCVDVRGNVNTRLAKLDSGEFDALILAAAGLLRLDLSARIRDYLPTSLSLPAVGQGALGLETRHGDTEVEQLLAPLHHQETADCVNAERAMNRHLNGGCQVPIAGFATKRDNSLALEGRVGDMSERRLLLASANGNDPEQLGVAVAEALLEQGAKAVLDAYYADDAVNSIDESAPN
ncbi:hydroxymethylbilane synthase [bacterium]|nr:hydroxymethylbilane synthase [bacterium]